MSEKLSEFQKKRTGTIIKKINEEWSEEFMKFIEKYEEKLWNWSWLSKNPNLTIEIIEKYPEKPWDWINISYNKNITMEMIEKHPEKPWNWSYLSYNPNLIMEFIEKYPNKQWNWSFITGNPNITMEIIEKHQEKQWNWNNISLNSFKKEKEKFIEKRLREHMAAYRIQQHWFKAKMDPSYTLCKKMVNDFYDRTIMPMYM